MTTVPRAQERVSEQTSEQVSGASRAEQKNEWTVRAKERADERKAHSNIPISRCSEWLRYNNNNNNNFNNNDIPDDDDDEITNTTPMTDDRW